MISIIIPIYNGEKYIKRCIEKLLKQQNTEIIIVDDGSNDNTEDILKEYNKIKKIKIIKQKNKGVSEARNRGIQEAKGEYIMFCDIDDLYDDNVINNISKKIKAENDDLIIFGRKDVSENKIICEYPIKKIGNNINNIEYAEQYFANGKHTFSVGNKVYKKQIIMENSIKFDKSLKFSEDMLFNLRYILCCDKIGVEENCYYLRFCNLNSTIYKANQNFFNENIKAIGVFESNLKENEKEKFKKIILELYAHYAVVSIHRICEGMDSVSYRVDIKRMKMIIQDIKNRNIIINEGEGVRSKIFNFCINNNHIILLYFIFGFLKNIYHYLKERKVRHKHDNR